MWFGILFAILVEIVPLQVRSTTVGLFLFVMNNIGGNLPILVDPVSKYIGFRESLYIFYGGAYGLSKFLELISSQKHSRKRFFLLDFRFSHVLLHAVPDGRTGEEGRRGRGARKRRVQHDRRDRVTRHIHDIQARAGHLHHREHQTVNRRNVEFPAFPQIDHITASPLVILDPCFAFSQRRLLPTEMFMMQRARLFFHSALVFMNDC